VEAKKKGQNNPHREKKKVNAFCREKNVSPNDRKKILAGKENEALEGAIAITARKKKKKTPC